MHADLHQEQSTLGLEAIPRKPARRLTPPQSFLTSSEKLIQRIRAVGAKLVALMTWAAKTEPDTQDFISGSYEQMAKANGIDLVRTGTAFAMCRQQNPDIDLYGPDGRHPSPAGSYLAALTLSVGIFRTPIFGTQQHIMGPAISGAGLPLDQLPDGSYGRNLVHLDETTARRLPMRSFRGERE